MAMTTKPRNEQQLTLTDADDLELSRIDNPRDMLQVMMDNADFIGGDPYYRGFNDLIWKHVERVLDQAKGKRQ